MPINKIITVVAIALFVLIEQNDGKPVDALQTTVPPAPALPPQDAMVMVPIQDMSTSKPKDELLDTANSMVFMPLFTYRRIASQRRRVYANRRNGYGYYYDSNGFPTIA